MCVCVCVCNPHKQGEAVKAQWNSGEGEMFPAHKRGWRTLQTQNTDGEHMDKDIISDIDIYIYLIYFLYI